MKKLPTQQALERTKLNNQTENSANKENIALNGNQIEKPTNTKNNEGNVDQVERLFKSSKDFLEDIQNKLGKMSGNQNSKISKTNTVSSNSLAFPIDLTGESQDSSTIKKAQNVSGSQNKSNVKINPTPYMGSEKLARVSINKLTKNPEKPVFGIKAFSTFKKGDIITQYSGLVFRCSEIDFNKKNNPMIRVVDEKISDNGLHEIFYIEISLKTLSHHCFHPCYHYNAEYRRNDLDQVSLVATQDIKEGQLILVNPKKLDSSYIYPLNPDDNLIVSEPINSYKLKSDNDSQTYFYLRSSLLDEIIKYYNAEKNKDIFAKEMSTLRINTLLSKDTTQLNLPFLMVEIIKKDQVNTSNIEEQTFISPLQYACYLGLTEIVAVLIKYIATLEELNYQDLHHRTAISHTISGEGSLKSKQDILELLIKKRHSLTHIKSIEGAEIIDYRQEILKIAIEHDNTEFLEHYYSSEKNPRTSIQNKKIKISYTHILDNADLSLFKDALLNQKVECIKFFIKLAKERISQYNIKFKVNIRISDFLYNEFNKFSVPDIIKIIEFISRETTNFLEPDNIYNLLILFTKSENKELSNIAEIKVNRFCKSYNINSEEPNIFSAKEPSFFSKKRKRGQKEAEKSILESECDTELDSRSDSEDEYDTELDCGSDSEHESDSDYNPNSFYNSCSDYSNSDYDSGSDYYSRPRF